MAREQSSISISVKLIVISTIVVTVSVALFGVMNNLRSRRLLDEATDRLQKKITDSLRHAGVAQLELFGEMARLTLLQNDFPTIQTAVENSQRRDDRILEVAVIDKEGAFVAHSDKKRSGEKAPTKLLDALKKVDKPQEAPGGPAVLGFATPVVNEGERLGHVYLTYSLKPLRAELAQATERKQREVGRSLQWTLIIGLLSILIGAVLAVVQGLRISRPIRALAAQADQIASGDLLARVPITSRDEIGFLGTRFNFMAEQVLVLMRETSQKATMEKELEVASAVQSTLVPPDKLVQLGSVTLSSYFKPATQCGGDWWSYYELANDELLLIVGDVTGHGVASAMITAAAKGAATSVIASSNRRLGPAEVLINLNEAIHEAAKGRFVMTCFASVYNPKTRQLAYANAGHCFPYMIAGGTGRMTSLIARGNRLGDVLDSKFKVKTVTIEPDTTFVWYTDGIVEGVNEQNVEYGDRRFRNSIKENAKLTPSQLRSRIVSQAFSFFGDIPPKDDITLVVGKLD